MTDKELLELAAKAAGMRLNHAGQPTTGNYYDLADFNWNPLTDDGDAFRLMVKLEIDVWICEECGERMAGAAYGLSGFYLGRCIELLNDKPYAAVRRAIVRAAAEIGREMK